MDERAVLGKVREGCERDDDDDDGDAVRDGDGDVIQSGCWRS